MCNFISGKPGKAGTDAIQMQVGFAETCFGNNLFEKIGMHGKCGRLRIVEYKNLLLTFKLDAHFMEILC